MPKRIFNLSTGVNIIQGIAANKPVRLNDRLIKPNIISEKKNEKKKERS